MRAEPIRIANGQGFWGDSVDAPAKLVRGGPIDYLTLDYLAEVTMSIMQRQKSKNPKAGYASDFVNIMRAVFPELIEKEIKVVTNAGGVNLDSCFEALRDTAKELGLSGIKIGIVSGDDILERLDELLGNGIELANMESGKPLSEIREEIVSANVYFGAAAMAEALDLGADIVIAGRVTDTGLALAPMMHEFGWKTTDYDLLAAGTVAGHILECGAQSTGGNYTRWWDVPDYANIGYPIVEAYKDGSFVLTKHEGTGGLINKESVSEQLLYEMGEPTNYITPDCVVDFTSIKLEEEGADRVRISGVNGGPATDSYKVSINHFVGYKASGSLTISGPFAVAKAKKCAEIIWERLDESGCKFEAKSTEFLGLNSSHGDINPMPEQVNEIVLRLGVRDRDKAAVERFGKELAPLITNGPPGITGFAGGRPRPQNIYAFWPALINKDLVKHEVRVETI
ncbi:MAG: DUF1446 domain-containing protein [Candidatus Marinimicrobia bacterium]|nr:DUF1446 domain-containing protein [Candidatus Neomarinimicrobiota bacterium]